MRQPELLHQLSIEVSAISLRRIYGGDIAIADQGLHGAAAHAEETCIARIGAPLDRCAQYFARRNVV